MRFKAWQRTGVLKHVLTQLFGVAGEEFHTAIVARMRHPQAVDPAAQSHREGSSLNAGTNVDKVWDAAPLQNAFSPLSSRIPLMANEPAAPDYRGESVAHPPTLAEAATAVAVHAETASVHVETQATHPKITAGHIEQPSSCPGADAVRPAGDAVGVHGETIAPRSVQDEDDDDDAQRPASLDHGPEH